MNEKCISSLHVQKLGHEILEIRERALFNISSKLEHGLKFDNSLARSKEILIKLFEWFLLEPCTKQDFVFSLIKRILQSETGQILLNHYGPAIFQKEVQHIRTYIEPKYYHYLEEISQIVNDGRTIVPPLETDVPLSYRSDQSDFKTQFVETTATTIEGYIAEEASARQRNTPQSVQNIQGGGEDNQKCLIQFLPWQFLIETDRHVLESIEESLKNPPQPVSIIHSTDFFMNILLHDFPAEVFLQRPNILFTFHTLLNNCLSTRIINSILKCLINLSRALLIRISFQNDPCLFTTKEIGAVRITSRCSTPDSSSRKPASGQSDEEYNEIENIDFLKTQQISFTEYCFSTFKCVCKYLCITPESFRSGRRKNVQEGVNLALELLDALLNLLESVLSQDIWTIEFPSAQKIRKEMSEILISYGTTLEYFRIEAAGDDVNVNNRVAQLCFLHHCANFLMKMVPISHTGFILPKNLKNALLNSLIDVIISKLYPNLYNTIFNYVQSFTAGLESDSSVKYHETQKICDSMTAAVALMKNYDSVNASESVNLAKKALPSLEFHKDLKFVKRVIELSSNKLPLYLRGHEELLDTFEFVILKLLSHNLECVREECYKFCQKRVIMSIGPKSNTSCTGTSGSQILFLCRSKILTEIACHGMASESSEIRNYSEDILIHIIKCKILISDVIWNEIVVALIGCFPVLLCHSTKQSALGRNLLNILDPDVADSLNLPQIEVVKGNVHLLFCAESSVREEAFSRLCWLLTTQKGSREMLPRLNNLCDKALPNICQVQRIFDINKTRSTQHFYQPSVIQQVLELLKSPNVEPVIRRSALTQISVMMEDPLLHTTFLANEGLSIVLNVMKSALIEKKYNDYPDSVIPIINILKNVCIFQSSARQSLCENIDVYYDVLRGLFMFFTEEKMKQDGACLLFLLIFNDYVKGTPSKGNLSIPYLASQKLQVPFSSSTHWEISQYYEPSLVNFLTQDKCCLKSLQIQWNCELFGGLEELLSFKDIMYTDDDNADILKLNNYDLASLRASNIDFYLRKYLNDIQNGTIHEVVIDRINKLTTYIQLSSIIPTNGFILDHQWERTFTRFLKILPSSEEDAKLLSKILRFLKRLVPFYKSLSEPTFWLSELLKNPANCLLDLVMVEPSSDEDFKTLSSDLLSLITLCASQEQHFLDYYSPADIRKSKIEIGSWESVIEIIVVALKSNDNTRFYNLSYLNSLLSCLSTLTANLGWTKRKQNFKILSDLVSSLAELIVVFHCGKGETATISVMGLSITRHVVLILNHLLAEMQNFQMKKWERSFMEIEESDWVKSFSVLWSSRDILLRAGASQLFAGLSVSPVIAIKLVNELKNESGDVWNLALNLLLDNDEASIVRENCAYLLTNLLGHSVNNANGNWLVVNSSHTNKKTSGNDVIIVFELLESHQFFKNVPVILSKLYTINVLGYDSKSAINLIEKNMIVNDYCSDSSKATSTANTIITPSLVKGITNLLHSLLNFSEDRTSYKLQDFGIVKLLFRCLCNPLINVTDTKKLSLYCDILEMDISLCQLLTQETYVNSNSVGTLLHTRDCLATMVALLNPNIYDSHLSQLLYLRNKLWTEIFKLLIVLTTFKNENNVSEASQILTQIIEETGKEAFVETMCEATRSPTFDELQSSALLSLTSLLGSESTKIHTTELNSESSLGNILDTVRTSSKVSARTNGSDTHEDLLAGAEICRILLDLYDLCQSKLSKDLLKKKSIITFTLTTILCVSREAKKFAFEGGLAISIMKQFKEFHMKLSLESVDCLRRVLERKKACPVMKELNELVGLTCNFMMGEETIKNKFAELGLSDCIHKLWVWLALQNIYLVDTLKMLVTFTKDCNLACQSLSLTSSVAGLGPRKVPGKVSLLHAIINLIEKEMDQVSKMHSLEVLELCFEVLKNCCSGLECRLLIFKSTLLSCMSRLHPAITKRQKPWHSVEFIWLEFLQTFTSYPEGQSSIGKVDDVFDLLLALTTNSKKSNRIKALSVLRNIAFYQPNRPRLLTSDDFLNLLQVKLDCGSYEEKTLVVLMMWSLAANSQKAKIVFKSAKLDFQLQQLLKHYQISPQLVSSDDIDTIKYVLSIIRDGEVRL